MSKDKNFEAFIFTFSSEERIQIEKLKHRFNCKTDSQLFHNLIWFFDDFDNSINDCQKNVNDLRNALYECLGIVSK